VHYREDAEYRKRLAAGFLNEARLSYQYRLWRSCVDNSQLSIEKSGKMIIALVEPVEKTHNPAHQLQRLTGQKRFDDSFLPQLQEVISILDRFGMKEHFMTDYGDETTHTDPWSLFEENDAKEALELADKCFTLSEEIYLSYTGGSSP
jgi:HEPN domain-containing protein